MYFSFCYSCQWAPPHFLPTRPWLNTVGCCQKALAFARCLEVWVHSFPRLSHRQQVHPFFPFQIFKGSGGIRTSSRICLIFQSKPCIADFWAHDFPLLRLVRWGSQKQRASVIFRSLFHPDFLLQATFSETCRLSIFLTVSKWYLLKPKCPWPQYQCSYPLLHICFQILLLWKETEPRPR